MPHDAAYSMVAKFAQHQRLLFALLLLLVFATQGSVAESGEFAVSPLEEGSADYGPDEV